MRADTYKTGKDVRKTVLDNGLRIISERVPGVRSVSLGVWIEAGSATDPVDKTGLAHFTEHMMFKGTKNRSALDIASSLEAVGGSLDAFTTRDMTCFSAYILDQHLHLAVDVIGDILNNSVFSKKEISKEKKVVLEEIASAKDVPEELAQDTFADMLLNPSPESKPILGIRKSVSSITRDDIVDYIQRNYSSSNVTIAAAGNLEHEVLAGISERTFAFSDSGKPQQFINRGVKQPVFKLMKRDIGQAHICMGGRTFGYNDRKRYPLLLLNTCLGYGMSSRLFQNIREKHALTYSIYSYTELFRNVGMAAVYAATDLRKVNRTRELITKEYNRFRTEFLDCDTLEQVKSQIKGGLLLSHENTMDRMNRLAKSMIYHDRIYDIDEVTFRIDSVSREEVLEVAEEVLNENNIRTLVVSH